MTRGEEVVALRRQLQTEAGRDEARRRRARLVAAVSDARAGGMEEPGVFLALGTFDGLLYLAAEIAPEETLRVETWDGSRRGWSKGMPSRDAIGTPLVRVQWDDITSGEVDEIELFEVRAAA